MRRVYSTPFAPITAFLQEFLNTLPRCCAELYQWIRRKGKPESPIEFGLEEFAQQFDYSMDWAVKCLKRLFKECLLTEDRQAWGRWYRVILHDPDFKPTDQDTASDRESRTPKKRTSNPRHSVPDPKGEKFKSLDGLDEQNGGETEKANSTPHPQSTHNAPCLSQVESPEPQTGKADTFSAAESANNFSANYFNWLNGERQVNLDGLASVMRRFGRVPQTPSS